MTPEQVQLSQQQRKVALDWWRNLLIRQRMEYHTKYFPDWKYTMVTNSTSAVVTIWKGEGNAR